MRRSDICLYLGHADRVVFQALIANRKTPRKLVWRAGIVLATADGRGTFEIMRRAARFASRQAVLQTDMAHSIGSSPAE
jgi:hypothetical protein